MANTNIIDTAWDTSFEIACLKNIGISTVTRYYAFNNTPHHPSKIMTLEEATRLTQAGFQIAVFFEQNNLPTDFDFNKGYMAGKRAYSYASETIGQPQGSAIYFAVDYDAMEQEAQTTIKEYFQGVLKAFNDLSGMNPIYAIGAYGSGGIVNYLYNSGLCKYRWIAGSYDWWETRIAINNGNYEVLQRPPSTENPCELILDFDQLKDSETEFGSFSLSHLL